MDWEQYKARRGGFLPPAGSHETNPFTAQDNLAEKGGMMNINTNAQNLPTIRGLNQHIKQLKAKLAEAHTELRALDDLRDDNVALQMELGKCQEERDLACAEATILSEKLEALWHDHIRLDREWWCSMSVEKVLELERELAECRKEREQWRPLLERLLRQFQGDWPTISVAVATVTWVRLPVDDETRDAIVAARRAITEADDDHD